MRKGEVWIIEIPGIDGHEQRGLRPALFIADTKTSMALMIPFTSNLKALRFAFTVRIQPSQRNGLNAVSVALVSQLRAIDKKRLQKKIGILDTKIMKELEGMIKNLLGL